jgi:hypothetical protein
METELSPAVRRMRVDYRQEKLGPRKQARLREDLPAYTEAKALIGRLTNTADHRKRAITLLYRGSGGNRWPSPGEVARIVDESRIYSGQK